MNASKDLSQARVTCRHLNSKFKRKIRELVTLKTILDEVCEDGKVTPEDCEKLQELLNDLSFLKQQNETVTDEFSANFRSRDPQGTEEADKALEDGLYEYNNIALASTRLLRRIRQQLSGTNDPRTRESDKEKNWKDQRTETKQRLYRRKTEAKPTFGGHHQQRQDKDNGNEAEDKEEKEVSLKKTIVKGILIAIIFYCGLGGVIKLVLDRRTSNDKVGGMFDSMWYCYLNFGN